MHDVYDAWTRHVLLLPLGRATIITDLDSRLLVDEVWLPPCGFLTYRMLQCMLVSLEVVNNFGLVVRVTRAAARCRLFSVHNLAEVIHTESILDQLAFTLALWNALLVISW